MKITCNVVQDILPLYLENIVSEDTKKLVEEHINSCENCKKHLSDMSASTPVAPDVNMLPMKRLKTMLFKKKIRTIVVSVILALLIATIVISNLVAPRYYPFSDNVVTLTESDNGLVYVTFDDKVSGYGVSSYLSDDKTGYAYHIVAWDSVWDGKIMKNDLENVVLNPNGEKVSAVYYYETDGSGEILLYGEQQNPCGVIIKQPKLALYLICAAILATICLVLLIIYRKNKNTVKIIATVFLLPISYLLSHLLFKGFSVTGYSTTEDFWTILLFMIPIYTILFICIYLLIFRKNKPLKM